MRPDFILQKILLGTAIAAAVLAIGLPVFVMGLGLRLPPAAGWLTVLALPFIAAIAILAAGLFLGLRLFQKDGLGTPAIAFASLLLLAVPASVTLLWAHGKSARDPVRENNQHQLTTLASSQPEAFFALLDSLAPLDKAYLDQVKSLLISKGFIRADPELVRNYFQRGTNHVPTGDWIPKCLLAGIEESASNPSPDSLRRIRAVLAHVQDAYPSAFTQTFEYSGITNTFDRIARQRADNRFVPYPERYRMHYLQVLDGRPANP